MKRYAASCSLTLALVFLVGACSSDAPDASGTMRGQLTMKGSVSFDNIAITLVGPTVRATQPDTAGAFAIDALPAGAYTLFVDAGSTRPAQVRRDVTIVASQETTVDSIALDPTARVRARILLDGTSVHLGTTITSSDGGITTTDENGDFELAVGLETQTIVASHSGCRPEVLDVTGLARGATVELGTHTLVAGESVRFDVAGSVVVAGSLERADVTVAIDALGVEAKSDAAGVFVLPQIGAGVYTLRFTRGEMQETLSNVLVGLDGAKVIASDIIFDLGVVELTAGKRLSSAPWEYTEVTAGGRFGIVRGGLNRQTIALWDLTTDTSLLRVDSPPDSFAPSKAIVFDGDRVFVLSGASTTWGRQLLRIDTKALTTTVVTADFSFAQHFVATRTTGITRSKSPGAPGTYELWSWDGGDPIVIEHMKSAARSERTVFFTSSDPTVPHTWRRASDGVVLASIPGNETVGSPAFSDDEATMAVVVGDHVEVLRDTGTVDKLTGTTAQPRFAGDVLWLSAYPNTLSARRLSDLGEVVTPVPNATVIASRGATTLIATWQTSSASQQLVRYSYDEMGVFRGEPIGVTKSGVSVTPTTGGFWVVAETAFFVPLTGAVSTKHETYLLAPNISADGALIYLDAAAATGSSMRRLTSNGDDSLIAENVVDYSMIDDDLLVKSTVGDRLESFLLRPATGERRALGTDRIRPTRIAPNAYYVARSAPDAQSYRDGLMRVGFGN